MRRRWVAAKCGSASAQAGTRKAAVQVGSKKKVKSAKLKVRSAGIWGLNRLEQITGTA